MDKLPSKETKQRIKKFFGLQSSTIQLRGPFNSWADARKKSTGYDTKHVLAAVLDAALLASGQDGVYERDSVLVGPEQRSWPLSASLLFAASALDHRFRVVDFGGSLGSAYFHNRELLDGVDLEWIVIEQKKFVKAGRKHFQNNELSFTDEVGSKFNDSRPLVLLISSALQYVEKPFTVLERLLESKPDFIIFDRTPFHGGSEDILMVQDVPAQIYEASYPIWIFSEPKLMRLISVDYQLVSPFTSPEGRIHTKKIEVVFQGLFFRIKKL